MLPRRSSIFVLNPLNDFGRSVFLEILLRGSLLAVVAAGHFGFWIWLYNRVNSTGLPRKTIKRTEKLIVLVCGLIPIALLWYAIQSLSSVDFLSDGSIASRVGSLLAKSYCTCVGLFAVLMTPFLFDGMN